MDKEILDAIKAEHSSIQNQINDLNEKMKEKSKELMKEAFRGFFEKYSDVVENVFWTQYAPYFNDGEECVFSVHDVHILIKNDEDACEYEGSNISDAEDIESIEKVIADIEEWEKDPMTAARKYQSDYIKRYNRDPFGNDSYYGNQYKTPIEKMMEWKPHYGTKDDYQNQLEAAKKLLVNYPNLKKDFYEIRSMIDSIDENLMKAMFGNHVKVIVSTQGIEVEEYDHD